MVGPDLDNRRPAQNLLALAEQHRRHMVDLQGRVLHIRMVIAPAARLLNNALHYVQVAVADDRVKAILCRLDDRPVLAIDLEAAFEVAQEWFVCLYKVVIRLHELIRLLGFDVMRQFVNLVKEVLDHVIVRVCLDFKCWGFLLHRRWTVRHYGHASQV